MTVAELIEELKKYPQDMRVVALNGANDYSDLKLDDLTVVEFSQVEWITNTAYRIVKIPDVLHIG